MRFFPFTIFIVLWACLVYAPMAHWVWGGGWLAAGLLWFGWFGFNGGSGLNAGSGAVLSFTNTLVAPAATLVLWIALDFWRGGKATAIGAATAIIVGCVLITPAAGWISPLSAILLGAAGAIPSYALIVWRPRTRVDETLDVLAAHGLSGLVGILFISLFRPAELERRQRRSALGQRLAVVGPGGGRRGRPGICIRRHLRAPARDRRVDLSPGGFLGGRARARRRAARRGGLRAGRRRDPHLAGGGSRSRATRRSTLERITSQEHADAAATKVASPFVVWISEHGTDAIPFAQSAM